jgi:excisionase family DNA binding protein
MTRSAETITTPRHSQPPSRVMPLWTPTDAAAYLGVHEKTVIRMARLQQVPALRLGKHWRFRESDLTAWAENQIQLSGQPVE